MTDLPDDDHVVGDPGHTIDHNIITEVLIKHTDTSVFDVTGYGAYGNDTTDDTAAISAAITAANVAGGVVWFGDHTNVYKISDSLTTLASNVTLLGSGATIHQTGINAALTSTVPNPGTAVYSAVRVTGGASEVTIDGLRFTADNNPWANVPLHWSTSVEFLSGATEDCVVKNCRFENLYGFAVHNANDTGRNVSVVDCVFDGTGQAINVNAGQSIIRGNFLNNAQGIEVAGANITVADNVVIATPYGNAGISLGGNTSGSYYAGATCTGNTILNSGGHGISIPAGAADCVVANNSIINATRIGIFCGNGGSGAVPQRVLIANNVITSCGLDTESDGNQQGMYITGISDVHIVGNKIGNNPVGGYTTLTGIQVYQCAGAVVTGNSAEGVTGKSLSCNGTTDIVAGQNRWDPTNEEFISGCTFTSVNYYFYGNNPVLKLGDGTAAADAIIHIQPDTNHKAKVSFNDVTTPTWEIFYDATGTRFYVRDSLNGTNPLFFDAGSFAAAQITANTNFKVEGKVGFAGSTPIARPSAYTQTYATANRTQSNPTAAALTVTDGTGTNDGTIGAITADASVIAAVQEIAAMIAKVITDHANTKQVLNSVVDDMQSYGLLQ